MREPRSNHAQRPRSSVPGPALATLRIGSTNSPNGADFNVLPSGATVPGSDHDSLERHLHALQRALEIAQRRYVRGVASSLDVLDSRRSLYSAQLALVQARAQYLTATVDPYQALGGGWNATPQ